ncbi:MAG: restriction endonuclease [Clostridium perfringens]|nr:restriction endonuclease [Clostridium perfringens]
MSFVKLLMIIISLIFINSILTNKIKKIERKINNDNSYKLDFRRLAKKYIESLGYDVFLQEDIENITIYNNEELVLICCKDLRKEDKKANKNYIMRFISDIALKSASKGILIYNGEISKEIKNILKDNKNFDFYIELISEEEILAKINKGVLS